MYRETMEQKLKYLHENSLKKKWCLCKCPEGNEYSSATFYHTGKDEGGFPGDYLD